MAGMAASVLSVINLNANIDREFIGIHAAILKKTRSGGVGGRTSSLMMRKKWAHERYGNLTWGFASFFSPQQVSV